MTESKMVISHGTCMIIVHKIQKMYSARTNDLFISKKLSLQYFVLTVWLNAHSEKIGTWSWLHLCKISFSPNHRNSRFVLSQTTLTRKSWYMFTVARDSWVFPSIYPPQILMVCMYLGRKLVLHTKIL